MEPNCARIANGAALFAAARSLNNTRAGMGNTSTCVGDDTPGDLFLL